MNLCSISSELNKTGRGNKTPKKTVHLWCTSTFFRGNADQQMSGVLQHECVESGGGGMLIITFGTLTNYGASNRKEREREREWREEKKVGGKRTEVEECIHVSQ